MDVNLVIQNHPGGSLEKERKGIENTNAIKEYLQQIKDNMDDNLKASNELRDYNSVISAPVKNLLDKVTSVLPLSGQPESDAVSKENPSEGNTDTTKKNMRKLKNKASAMNEVKSMDQNITENLTEISESEKNLINKDETVQPLSKHLKLDAGSTECALEVNIDTKKRKRPEGNKMNVKVMNESESHLSSSDVKEEKWPLECLGKYPKITKVTPIRRKLLVLDVNGLLAHVIMPAPKDCRADTHILGRAIFKRPFCDDFLNFCFQNFDVGIWSSRSKIIIDRVADYLLGNRKDRILFCWNMSHATQTGFKTLENSYKPLVFKELRKIWENSDPNSHWKNGDYDESNTLLLDDSPYKALLNPLHTAIFPSSFRYGDKNDNSLGPGGDLRVYLEGLLRSGNVQTYVEQRPFGQCALNETNPSWEFYTGVLQTMNQSTSSLHLNAPLSN